MPHPERPGPDVRNHTTPETIELNVDRKGLLKEKLREYRKRDDPNTYLDTAFKIAVLNELISTGEVDVDQLRATLQKEYKNTYDECTFKDACTTINQYSNEVGQPLVGGTGL